MKAHNEGDVHHRLLQVFGLDGMFFIQIWHNIRLKKSQIDKKIIKLNFVIYIIQIQISANIYYVLQG